MVVNNLADESLRIKFVQFFFAIFRNRLNHFTIIRFAQKPKQRGRIEIVFRI